MGNCIGYQYYHYLKKDEMDRIVYSKDILSNMSKHQKHINWKRYVKYYPFDLSVYLIFKDKIPWDHIPKSKYMIINEKSVTILRDHIDIIKYVQIRYECRGKLSIEFLFENADYLDWYMLTQNHPFTIDELYKVKEYIKWDILPYNIYRNLSEDNIVELKDNIDWFKLLVDRYTINGQDKREHILFTDGFISEYKDRMNWNVLTRYHPFTKGQLLEYEIYIRWEYFDRWELIDTDFVDKLVYKDYFMWDIFLGHIHTDYMQLNNDFIERNAQYIGDGWKVLIKNYQFDRQQVSKYRSYISEYSKSFYNRNILLESMYPDSEPDSEL